MINKTTEQETKQGYKECKCGKLLLLESGFEVNPYFCKECNCFAATKEDFFSVPVEILSK